MNFYLLFIEIVKKRDNLKIKRNFFIGDEWIYFKYYCGTQTADRILEEAIKPSVNHLLTNGKIDHWYFIRYSDPDLHLRVRLHSTNLKNVGIIIRTMFNYINIFLDLELIWKVQTDTYQREIERYGAYTMELSEQIFFLDSNLFLNVLPYFKKYEGETQRWYFALKSIDCILDCFQFKIEDKLSLLERLKDSFGREFEINRPLKDLLNKKFSGKWKEIERIFNNKLESETILKPIFDHLQNHKDALCPIAIMVLDILKENHSNINTNDLLASYIHMMMNRIFRSKQRIHELVLYDFLFRYYKSAIARLKASEKTILQSI